MGARCTNVLSRNLEVEIRALSSTVQRFWQQQGATEEATRVVSNAASNASVPHHVQPEDTRITMKDHETDNDDRKEHD